MKLGKTARWILGIGIFILAGAILFALFTGQSSEATQLEDNLEITQGILTNLIADKEDMTAQLAQYENELADAQLAFSQSQAKFPKEVASIEYDEEIFSAADDYNLEVMTITTSEPRVVKTEVIDFMATYFEVEVRGTMSNILSFVNNVATGGYFNAATFELANIEGPEPGQDELPSGTIKITVYSYEGE
jgi:hypothetical protein